MEVGESSGSQRSQEEVWAKLVPSDSRYPEVEISSDETSVRSEITSVSRKIEWCHITRSSNLCSARMKNLSSSDIVVDGANIQYGDVAEIRCGSQIIPGPDGRGHLKYRFEVMTVQNGPGENRLKIRVDVEHAKCSICLNIWHDVVTVAPCLHNFCNGCFSEWLKRSHDKHTGTLCPQCRGVVQFVGRNHFLHNIEENILQADSSLRRPKEELDVLDSYARIKSNMILGAAKSNSRKRNRSPVYVESDNSYNDSEDLEHPCPQCAAEVNGFRCNPNTVHLQCQSCGGMMPSRTDTNTPQHCLGCDRAFCGAYWQSQRISEVQVYMYPVCCQDTFLPVSEHRLSRVPSTVHEGNQHEQEITERCIQKMGKTLQDIISECTARLDNREIDLERMSLNHADIITRSTHLCKGHFIDSSRECYEKLVSFLLYWFRVTLPTRFMPADAVNRVNCWYGYGCRTQHHSADHARKRNHVCRPTRGSHM